MARKRSAGRLTLAASHDDPEDKLLLQTQLPDWYLIRQLAVVGGYRQPAPPLTTFLSLFRWHNETLNIYTHLLPGIYFFMVLCGLSSQPYYLASSTEARLTMALAYLVCTLCCFCSAAMHLMYPVNAFFLYWLERIDQVGIVLINLGKQMVDNYILCMLLLRSPQLWLYCACAISALAIFVSARIMTEPSAGLYWALVYPGLTNGPIATAVFIYSRFVVAKLSANGVNTDSLNTIAWASFYCTLWVVAAGNFYMHQFPEKYWNPRRVFDYFSSHTMMHSTTIAGILAALQSLPLFASVEG